MRGNGAFSLLSKILSTFNTQIIVKEIAFVLSIVTLNYHVENMIGLPISFISIVTHLPYFPFP